MTTFQETLNKLSKCSVSQILQLVDLNQLSITRTPNETQETIILELKKLQNNKKFKIYEELLSEGEISMAEYDQAFFEIIRRDPIIDDSIILRLSNKIDSINQLLDESLKRPRTENVV